MIKVNWINNILIEKINNKIEKINKDFYELGKEFRELKEKKILNYKEIEKKYLLNKTTVNKYIAIAEFIDNNKLNNYTKIGIKKLNLLMKIDNKEKVQKIVNNIEKYSLEDIKKEIKEYKNRRLTKKCFNLNEMDETRFNKIKEYIEKETNSKLTNSQILTYLIDYFFINQNL